MSEKVTLLNAKGNSGSSNQAWRFYFFFSGHLLAFDFGLKDRSPEHSSRELESTKVTVAYFNHRILWG